MTHVFEALPEADDTEPVAKIATVKRKKKNFDRARLYVYTSLIALFIISLMIGVGLYKYAKWSDTWSLHFQIPIQNFIRIEPRVSQKVQSKPVKQPMSFEEKIQQAFGVHAQTFIKIAKAESGHQAGAKGYNCFYYNSKGERYSTSCKPEDRGKAWSVDCGALQVNVYGQKCPDELYDLDVNLKAAVGKFQRQGFDAWSVCTQKKIQCI